MRPVFGEPAPFVPAPDLPPGGRGPAPVVPGPAADVDCADACRARGLVCVAEGLCAEEASHDSGLPANVGRYAVAPLGDPSRPDGVVVAYHEYLWSAATEDRSFLHVGVLGARDGSFEELARERVPPSNWVMFDVAAGGARDDRRVLIAWQENGVRLGSYPVRGGASRVVQVSTHPIENVLDVVGTPTGGYVADGEPGDNPAIAPRLYRIDSEGGVLGMLTPPGWEEGSMLDRVAGATLVAAADGGVVLAYVRRSIDPVDASAALEVLRDRNSLAEVERATLRPSDGSQLTSPYEPVRAWSLDHSGRVLFALSQPSDEGTRTRLGLSALHVGAGDSIALGPALEERPDDIASVSVQGIDRAVSVTLRVDYSEDWIGCGPPPLRRADIVVSALDLGALAPSGDAVLVEGREAADGEWELYSAPRVVPLGDGTYGFVVLWLNEGTIRHRRFQILEPEAPPPSPGS